MQPGLHLALKLWIRPIILKIEVLQKALIVFLDEIEHENCTETEIAKSENMLEEEIIEHHSEAQLPTTTRRKRPNIFRTDSSARPVMASENETWELVGNPINCQVTGSRIVLWNKYKSNGTLEKRMARLVAQKCKSTTGITLQWNICTNKFDTAPYVTSCSRCYETWKRNYLWNLKKNWPVFCKELLTMKILQITRK